MKGYEFDISKLAENSDVVFGLKEISDKIDTLIALKQVELSLLQQQRAPQGEGGYPHPCRS